MLTRRFVDPPFDFFKVFSPRASYLLVFLEWQEGVRVRPVNVIETSERLWLPWLPERQNTQSYSEAAAEELSSSVIAWGTQFLVDDGSVRSVVCV